MNQVRASDQLATVIDLAAFRRHRRRVYITPEGRVDRLPARWVSLTDRESVPEDKDPA